MATLLITGANRGIGLALARRYGADGWSVIGTVRDPGKAQALREIEGDVRIETLALDGVDASPALDLANRLAGVTLDAVILNAGIYGPQGTELDHIDYLAWDETLRINVLAPVMVAQAFYPLLLGGRNPRLVAISSGMGSITNLDDPGNYPYRSSKACLNAAMKGLSLALAPKGVIVAMMHPGWVRTDMGGPQAALAPEESADGLFKVISGLHSADNGGFFDYSGKSLPF